jgi:Secretion system C-terminal sorting domain
MTKCFSNYLLLFILLIGNFNAIGHPNSFNITDKIDDPDIPFKPKLGMLMAPFPCQQYITRQINGATELSYVYRSTTGSTTNVPVCTYPELYNATVFYNGRIFTWLQNGGAQLKELMEGCSTPLSTSFPTLTGNYNTAFVDANGIYYVMGQSSGSSITMNRINLATSPPTLLTALTLNLPAGSSVDPAAIGDGYVVGNSAYLFLNLEGLFKFTIPPLTTTSVSASKIFTTGVAADTSRIIGSLFAYEAEVSTLYGYGSTSIATIQDRILKININTGAVEEISTPGTPVSQSDGGGCLEAPFANPNGKSVSGNVYSDINGLLGSPSNTVNGIGANISNQMYVSLANNITGIIYLHVPVAADGSFTFPYVDAGTYRIIIGTSSIGNTSSILPSNYVHTGEVNNNGNSVNASGSDGDVNGTLLNVIVGTSSNVTNLNFGIEQLPTANTTLAASQVNPGGTSMASIPANAFSGTDPDAGLITAIRITAFPSNTTSITVDGVIYSSLAAINIAYPNGIPTNVSGQPTVTIAVDPVDGAITVGIPYKTIDNAGKESSNTGSANQPFTLPVTYTIAGNVFNDVGGLIADNNVNGSGTNTSGTLYASLVNSGNSIISTVQINADGTYTFPPIISGNYSVILHTTATGSNTPFVPLGWAATGEDCCDNVGNDGTVNSVLSISLVTSNVTNANFGLEQLPMANTMTAASQVNQGGAISATLPTNAFGGMDTSSGIITAIRITTFPTNATSIIINEVIYTTLSAITTAYPNGIPTNASGQPTVTMAVDPVDGAVTVTILYKTIDNAGMESILPGSVDQPFSEIPLPLILNNFTATRSGNDIHAIWNTEVEINVSKYEIEFSTNGQSYTSLGTLAPQNMATNHYQFTIVNFTETIYYLRLKMIDIDGRFTYSNVAIVRMNRNNNLFNVYPNPANDFVNAELGYNAKGEYNIELIDVTGRIVNYTSVYDVNGNHLIRMHRNGIKNGIYILKMVSTHYNETTLTKVIFK